LTEVTGVANDFNSHQVVVDPEDEERAREVLGDAPDEIVPEPDTFDEADPSFLEFLRKRWMLLAFAFFMLLLVIFLGPID
jgi:hypothetical protein